MTTVEKMRRCLARFQDLLSEEMAEESRALALMEIGKPYGVEPFATGEIIPRTKVGNVLGYIPQYTTSELELLRAWMGAIRAHDRRPPPPASDDVPWREAM